MSRRSYRRLRTPVFALVFGSVISTAIGIGQSWVGAAIAFAVTVMVSAIFFLYGWSETDAAAVIGGKTDERQALVRLRAAHAGLVTAVVALGIACLASAIAKAVFWPYEIIVDVVAVAYLIGLRAYGVTLPATDSTDNPND